MPSLATVRRAWSIEMRAHHGRLSVVCVECSCAAPLAPGVSARSTALAHLAGHARRETLPAHLRTCQCHARGCRWHPRSRGCAGPVLLLLACESRGRRWRLADVCTACARATPHAAVVPDATTGGPAAARHPRAYVLDVLDYLAGCLPPGTGAASRLLAVQCALRSDASGRVRVPQGLLRSLRLAGDPAPWQDLEDAWWMHRRHRPVPTRAPVEVQLLDVFGSSHDRRARARAADWALRAAATHGSASRRLAGLALLAQPAHGGWGAATHRSLLRRCGLTGNARLYETLDYLTAQGLLSGWEAVQDGTAVRWRINSSVPPASTGPEVQDRSRPAPCP